MPPYNLAPPRRITGVQPIPCLQTAFGDEHAEPGVEVKQPSKQIPTSNDGQTTSTDYLVIISGTLSLMTPAPELYQVKDGEGYLR
ncbi:predicted protein [Chaetomium globosum CBS 148.51]|uniref:Uncharacterized protein n=1 Tax=Chaetomium globosum (strain ATCC 6205 / CBS 148.51 / DSM 1962 / NBRC 6347 / NRRL 1970) TaxID=306901 RepID=Q2GTG8_CHAGB|nr:uncharacterized protein CHGG_08736 [Chaetomium globosum CBS 148.51]EAQ84722.1 predicted protein [Chaetomium globosum CBS 148.51]